jgi:hypothetical protein
MYMEGCESRANVCRNGVARIGRKAFNTMKEAEAMGLELAKDWVNSHTAIQASTDRQFKVR